MSCKLGLPLFEVLLAFGIKKSFGNIMTACVILHNMIVEDERDLDLDYNCDNVGSHVKQIGRASCRERVS